MYSLSEISLCQYEGVDVFTKDNNHKLVGINYNGGSFKNTFVGEQGFNFS